METRSDSNAESLLAIVEQQDLFITKTQYYQYDEAGCQSTIGLIFASSTCLITWKIPNDSE